MVWVMTTRGRALSEAFNTGPANKALRANRWRPGSCFLNLWSKFWGFEALRAMADAAYLYFFEGVVRVRFSLLSSTFCFKACVPIGVVTYRVNSPGGQRWGTLILKHIVLYTCFLYYFIWVALSPMSDHFTKRCSSRFQKDLHLHFQGPERLFIIVWYLLSFPVNKFMIVHALYTNTSTGPRSLSPGFTLLTSH